MIYLDTSTAVPLFVREPASAAVDAWFEACTEPLLSSDWIVTEFASALSIKERSGMLLSKDARAAWRSFEAFCESGLRLAAGHREASQWCRCPRSTAKSMPLRCCGGFAGQSS